MTQVNYVCERCKKAINGGGIMTRKGDGMERLCDICYYSGYINLDTFQKNQVITDMEAYHVCSVCHKAFEGHATIKFYGEKHMIVCDYCYNKDKKEETKMCEGNCKSNEDAHEGCGNCSGDCKNAPATIDEKIEALGHEVLDQLIKDYKENGVNGSRPNRRLAMSILKTLMGE